jgi:tRNA threonylcarbamoyladenosine biosynthesis protein TsaB
MPADPPAGGPLVLAIESATPHGSVAIVSRDGLVGERRLEGGSRMDSSFLQAVDELLSLPGAGGRPVTHVAVSAGPGSFTGLRVGMAAAKGFCFGWGVPLLPVSTLHALAWRFRRAGATLCPVQDARRGELYASTFRYEGGGLARLSPDRAVPPDVLAGELPDGPLLFCGDAVGPFRDFLSGRFGARASFPPAGDEFPAASAVGSLALEMLASGAPLPDPATVVPAYARQSEAEVKREGLAGGISPAL